MTGQHPASEAGRLLQLARELEQAGRDFAVATVVSRRPPVSAQVGDKAIITADGRLVGWIGGSCSQPVVRREAVAAIQSGRPRLLRLTAAGDAAPPDPAGVTTLPMTCPSGGEAEIYIEPHRQRPRLVAVGDTPLVRALGLLAPVVGFDVTLVAEQPGELEGPVEWARRISLADFAATEYPAGTFFVVASAGHYDEEALQHALNTPGAHVALVASRRRAQAVFEVLRGSGCPAEQVARVQTPAGIDIAATTQEEIALAVLADVVGRYRRGMAAHAAAPVLGRDPVCGMDVEIAGARHTAEHAGQIYYFCCPHCRHRFIQDPARYLAAAEAESGATP